MANSKQDALRSLRKMLFAIAVLGVLTAAGALYFLWLMGEWNLHAIIATILGVFISMLLGCGLFALAFFSDKSGHDDEVTNGEFLKKKGKGDRQ